MKVEGCGLVDVDEESYCLSGHVNSTLGVCYVEVDVGCGMEDGSIDLHSGQICS